MESIHTNSKGEVETKTETLDYKSMKWGELRKYATNKGINTKGKTKAQILEELEDAR